MNRRLNPIWTCDKVVLGLGVGLGVLDSRLGLGPGLVLVSC